MALFEVAAVVEGAADKVETHRNEGSAYAAADRLAEELKESVGEAVQWCVYVTPFSARPDEDDGDVSRSWMPDARPYRGS